MVVHSIGHSKLPIERFIALLAARGVRLLVDVRSVPYSRFAPQFNRRAIEASLGAAGIGYLFLGDKLGGRINDPECYIDRAMPGQKAGAAVHLDYEVVKGREFFVAGVAELLARAEEGATAIMCSEEAPDKCHRKLIVGRRLAELGVELVHIRSKDGGGQAELFAGGREKE